jgi:excisionase family DNA binding protein
MPKVQDRIVPALRLKLHVDSILRVHQVAAILGLSCRMVRHLALHGKLRGYKTGPRLWAFRGSDVEAYSNFDRGNWDLRQFCRCSAQRF